MKIIKIVIRKVALPMHQSFTTGFGEIKSKDVVITELHTSDGLIGYGESSALFAPIYNHETDQTCFYIQEHFIAPKILGKEFNNIEQFVESYSDIVGNNIAKTGPECAFWHLLAQKQNVSLQELFGGEKQEVSVGESIGIKNTVDEVLKEVELRLQQGFARIKIKIKPGWDTEVLTAVRKKWPAIELMADANSAYNLSHLNILRSLDSFDLTMLEQPLHPKDFVGHAKLQRHCNVNICLDEGIENINDLNTAITLGSCRVVNIKPGRVGGILESIKIHDLAKQHNIGVWCGGMLETGIGRAFNLALATKDNFVYSADMSPYHFYFTEDITTPVLKVENGHISSPDKPGLGFTVKTEALENYTEQKVTLES